MNKYQKHSKARLRDNMTDPLDALLAEDHKESLENRDRRVTRAFTVAKKMFEVLIESDLGDEDRLTAVQLFGVLFNRHGK